MARTPAEDKKTIITEIKNKIRLINAIAGFVVITLLAVILRYLYEPITEATAFLPDVSIKLTISIVILLTLAGFFFWGAISRKIIISIEDYRNKLDRLLTVTRDLREEIYGDILLDKIMDYSLSITQSDAGSILLIEKGNLVFKIVKGDKSVELLGTSISKDQGIAGWVAHHGKRLHITDAQADERFNPDVDSMTGYQTRSVLCVPLMMKTGIVGVIELLNKKEGFYSSREDI